jgi:mono/diheme cytochrome c family protein
MKPGAKKALKGVGAIVGLALLGAATYVGLKVRAFDASMEKTYDLPPLSIERSTEPKVLARGEHLARGLGGCTSRDCHGSDYGGGRPLAMGPVGTFTGPNLTTLLPAYTDGELGRLVRFGVKKDGRSVRFMPVEDFAWMNDADVRALVSYLRTIAPVEHANGVVAPGVLGKVLDRNDGFAIDIARRMATVPPTLAGTPEPTAAYGAFLARGCTGCHGKGYSGGPIPGAPKELPTPLNLTPHASGLLGWTYEDFDHLMKKGVRKNGQTLNAFMPIDSYGTMDETEEKALFAYLGTLPPKPFGGR